MGLSDKITGRAKQAIGDLTDSPDMRRQGRREERKAEAKDEAARAEEEARLKDREAEDLERKT
jgi:uncharacterized protein YjbJ (UPF0337 family)